MGVVETQTSTCNAARLAVLRAKTRAAIFLAGRAPSSLSGIGLEYADFRDYEEGDDVKHIDWRLTARSLSASGDYRLIVREYRVEKRLRVIFVLDVTASMGFGKKMATMAYVVAMLAEASTHLEDEVGLVLLAGDKCNIIPRITPALVPYVLVHNVCKMPPFGSLRLSAALDAIKKLRVRGLMVVVTDYANDPGDYVRLADYAASTGNGLVFFLVYDRWEIKPPVDALVSLVDPETGTFFSGRLRELYSELASHVSTIRSYLRVKHARFIEIGGLSEAERRSWELLSVFMRAREAVLR